MDPTDNTAPNNNHNEHTTLCPARAIENLEQLVERLKEINNQPTDNNQDTEVKNKPRNTFTKK